MRVSKCLAGENGSMDMDKTLLQEKEVVHAHSQTFIAREATAKEVVEQRQEKIDYTFSVL